MEMCFRRAGGLGISGFIVFLCNRPDVFARLGRKAKTMLHVVTQELEIKSRTGGIHMVEIPSDDGSDGVAWPICSCYHGAEGVALGYPSRDRPSGPLPRVSKTRVFGLCGGV